MHADLDSSGKQIFNLPDESSGGRLDAGIASQPSLWSSHAVCYGDEDGNLLPFGPVPVEANKKRNGYASDHAHLMAGCHL